MGSSCSKRDSTMASHHQLVEVFDAVVPPPGNETCSEPVATVESLSDQTPTENKREYTTLFPCNAQLCPNTTCPDTMASHIGGIFCTRNQTHIPADSLKEAVQVPIEQTWDFLIE